MRKSNVFEAVKESVTTRQAAEYYGVQVGRNGMACCPFHDDKHPSMKVDRRFHCFGCQADGDVIDFTARLFGLSGKEAALKLAEDFSVRYDAKGHDPPRRRPVKRKISEELRYRQAEQKCFRVLCDYLHLLERWEKKYAPQTPEEAWNVLPVLRQDATIFSNCLLLGSTAAFTVIRNCRYRGDTIWIFLHTKKAILLCLITIFKYAKLTRIAVW